MNYANTELAVIYLPKENLTDQALGIATEIGRTATYCILDADSTIDLNGRAIRRLFVYARYGKELTEVRKLINKMVRAMMDVKCPYQVVVTRSNDVRIGVSNNAKDQP